MGGIYVANKVADGAVNSSRVVSVAELTPAQYNAAMVDDTGTAYTVSAAELNALASTGLDATELGYLNGVTAGTGAASKAVVLDSAAMWTVGSSGTPKTTATADKKFLGIYGESTATSGDIRAIYAKLYFKGATGGEVGRFYAVANAAGVAAGGTMNGIHATAEITTGGTISGQANAIRATIGTGAAIAPGGLLAAITAETNFYAGSTLPTNCYYMRFVSLGSTVQPNYVFSFEGLGSTALANAGTGANSAAVSTGGVAAKVLKVKVDGTDYWMPLFSSNS